MNNVKRNSKVTVLILFMCTFFLGSQIIGCTSPSERNKKNKKTESKFKEIVLASLSEEKINEEKYSEDTYGKNAQILNVCAVAFNKITDSRNIVKEKYNNYKVDNLLTQEVLSNKDSLNNAINQTNDLKNSLNEYKASVEKSTKGIEDSVKNLKISDSYKKSFLKSFNESLTSNYENTEAYYKIENDLFDNMVRLFEFFDALNGNFKVDGKSFMFYSQQNVDTYNEIISKNNDLSKQETEWMSNYNKKKSETINELKK